MKLPRVRFTVRALLALPATVALSLIAVDALTAKPSYWFAGTYEFDVVDARDHRPIKATVTVTYEGPLDGEPGSGASYTTQGLPYDKYRGMTPNVGYGGLVCGVRHRPATLIFRRRDLAVTEGVRFRVEADGHEPFEFSPVDSRGKPLEFETWDPPVFRVELRPEGTSGVSTSWTTRPELRLHESFDMFGGGSPKQ